MDEIFSTYLQLTVCTSARVAQGNSGRHAAGAAGTDSNVQMSECKLRWSTVYTVPETEVWREDRLLVELRRDEEDPVFSSDSWGLLGRRPSSLLSERDMIHWATRDQSMSLKDSENAQQNTLMAAAEERQWVRLGLRPCVIQQNFLKTPSEKRSLCPTPH